MFGGGQGRQVDIQPQPVVLEVMLQGPTFAPEQLLAALPQLRDMGWGEGIQHARDGRLVGKALAPPGVSQGQIGPQAGVDLLHRATSGQNTHQHIQQFVGRGMSDRFERQAHQGKRRRQEVGVHQTVAQDAQGGERSILRHHRQPNLGRHSTAPPVTSVQCILPLPIQLERGWNRFDPPRILHKI